MPDIHTLAEAAELLGLSASTLRQQVHNGALRARLVGKTYVVTAREIERYRLEHRGHLGRPEGAKDSRPRQRAKDD